MAKQKYVVLIEADNGRFRAELWWRPYCGWMLASTRWVSTKTWAVRDGKRVFGRKVLKD